MGSPGAQVWPSRRPGRGTLCGTETPFPTLGRDLPPGRSPAPREHVCCPRTHSEFTSATRPCYLPSSHEHSSPSCGPGGQGAETGTRHPLVLPAWGRDGGRSLGVRRGTHRALCPSSCGSSRVPVEPRRPGGHSGFRATPPPVPSGAARSRRSVSASPRLGRDGKEERLSSPVSTGRWRELAGGSHADCRPGLPIPHP